jgi:hypothetical protein
MTCCGLSQRLSEIIRKGKTPEWLTRLHYEFHLDSRLKHAGMTAVRRNEFNTVGWIEARTAQTHRCEPIGSADAPPQN